MWHYQVLVLIDFVWVFRAETSFGSKWEFCYAVVKFFLGGCNFTSNTRISLNSIVVLDWDLTLALINVYHLGEIPFTRLFDRRRITLLNLTWRWGWLSAFHLHAAIGHNLFSQVNWLSLSLIHLLGAQWTYLVSCCFLLIIALSELLSKIVTSNLRLFDGGP